MAKGGRGVAGPTRFACVRPPPARRTEDRGRAGSAAPPLSCRTVAPRSNLKASSPLTGKPCDPA